MSGKELFIQHLKSKSTEELKKQIDRLETKIESIVDKSLVDPIIDLERSITPLSRKVNIITHILEERGEI